jgi:sugar lactone lactonase YvrE
LGVIFFCITAPVARADIIVGNFGSTGTSALYRFREADGALLGGAGFNGAETSQGITLGPDGLMYAAGNNIGQGYIARNNPVTGQFLGYLVDPQSQPSAAPYQMPNGITFGGDGSLYSTSNQFQPNGATGVVRFNPTTGAYGGVVIAPGNNGLDTPLNVYTMRGTGDLLVTDGARINRYNKNTLAFVNTFVSAGSGGLGSFFHTTFGPDGNFYIADGSHNQILRYNGSTGAFMSVFISNIFSPDGMTFGNDGNFYAISGAGVNQQSVLKFNGTTGAPLGTFVPANSTTIPTALYLLTAPDVPEPAGVCTVVTAAGAMMMSRRPRAFEPGDRTAG